MKESSLNKDAKTQNLTTYWNQENSANSLKFKTKSDGYL